MLCLTTKMSRATSYRYSKIYKLGLAGVLSGGFLATSFLSVAYTPRQPLIVGALYTSIPSSYKRPVVNTSTSQMSRRPFSSL